MLMFDSHWMPRATPETADRMNSTVRMTMTMTRSVSLTEPTQPLCSMPAPICRAPRPSDAAEPNSVAKIAMMSMTLPTGPFAWRRPMRRENAAEISWGRPRRKVP